MTARFLNSIGLCIALNIMGTSAAVADEPWAFVQITCAPQISYFAIQRFTVMNIPFNGPYLTHGLNACPDAIAQLEREHQIFDSRGLRDRPYTCVIPAIPSNYGGKPTDARPGFTIRVVGHYDEKGNNEAIYHRMITDDVEIILNGKSIGDMRLNDYGQNFGPDTVSVAPDGVGLTTTICTISDTPPWITKHLTCSTE